MAVTAKRQVTGAPREVGTTGPGLSGVTLTPESPGDSRVSRGPFARRDQERGQDTAEIFQQDSTTLSGRCRPSGLVSKTCMARNTRTASEARITVS